MGSKLKPHSRLFEEKVQQGVPKGKVNYAGTISFLERIISGQDGVKQLPNAFTRLKQSQYY